MDYREQRALQEGDDAVVERCRRCGRIRYETDGIRPMAWYVDPSNPVGWRYVHQPSRNDPNLETPWKFPEEARRAR
jgi:hypothetical protein